MNEDSPLTDIRTPITEAINFLSCIADEWKELFPDQDFFSEYVDKMWNDDKTSGNNQIEELLKIANDKEFSIDGGLVTSDVKMLFFLTGLLLAATAYCIQAMKSEGNSDIAWSYAIDAGKHYSLYIGSVYININNNDTSFKKVLSELGKLGSDVTHKENRKMKSDVFDFLDKEMHKFKSMDAAAEAIAGIEVPMKFRTVRDWVGDWKREKLRSTGTP